MMQLMPGTAAALGVNPHDVTQNIQGGIHYLREQLANFGDEAKALAAYNWGPQHVVQAVKFASANGLRVAARGGGHSWCGLAVRQGGMLIDLESLNRGNSQAS